MIESLAGALSTTLNPAEIALRLGMAAVFGGVIGLDRERKVRRRTAGGGDTRPRDGYTPAAF